MERKQRVHFFVCASDKKTIEEIEKLSSEHGIHPDFIYRKNVTVLGIPMPVVTRNPQELKDSMSHEEYTEATVSGVNLFDEIVSESTDPVVACVPLITNWIQFYLGVLSRLYVRTLILYSNVPSDITTQQSAFATCLRSQSQIGFASSLEELFIVLGKKQLA